MNRKLWSCKQDQEEGRWENTVLEGAKLWEDIREGKVDACERGQYSEGVETSKCG